MANKDKGVKEKKQTSYFKDMKNELRKVIWPTPKELINNTVAVIAFVIIVAMVVFMLDFVFDNLNNYGIVRMQEKIQSAFKSEDTEAEEQNNVNELNPEVEVNTDEINNENQVQDVTE